MPGATALATAPRARLTSSIAAPTAATAAPVDRPCTIRAIISSGTPSARTKTSMAAAWTAIAASSTGRRPMWSDSRPTTSSAASTASAYTPNTIVVVIGEKPHSRW